MPDATQLERMADRALADLATGTLGLVRPPGVAAAQARAVARRRHRRVASAALATLLVLAGLGGYLATTRARGSAIPPATGPTATTPAAGPTGTPTPGPAASPTPTTNGGGTGTPVPTGVSYDASRIPVGSAGSALRRVRTTTQQPTADGTGIFRTVCLYSHMRSDDPVGAPGAAGTTPLYTFWGNTSTGAASTSASVAGSGNSTCRGGIVDRTAYYAPALINTRTRVPVAPTEVTIFHDAGRTGIDPASIRPIPAGLRMRAGDPSATSYQGTVVGGWTCWETYTGTFATIPTNCPAGQVRMMVFFPQCWDGVHLDSPDHHSHLAYPTSSTCPASHPVPLPELSFHVLYPVGPDLATSRLSTDTFGGQPGGLSMHGYWINGWDPAIQQTWVVNCVNKRVGCGSNLLGDGREISGDR